jgi:quinol monooxygenase YgiN
MMIILLVRLRIKPGLQQEIKAVAKAAVDATRKEQGCVSYNLLQDPYDDCEFRIIEEWASLEDLRAHGRMPHLAKWHKDSASLIEEKAINIYDSQAISL